MCGVCGEQGHTQTHTHTHTQASNAACGEQVMHLHSSVSGVSRPKHVQEVKKKKKKKGGGVKKKIPVHCTILASQPCL